MCQPSGIIAKALRPSNQNATFIAYTKIVSMATDMGPKIYLTTCKLFLNYALFKAMI